MSQRSIFFGSLFAIGLLLIAREEYYPRSGMFTAMGMAGPRANSGRRCRGISVVDIVRLDLPRTEICSGEFYFNRSSMSHSENVAVSPLTHRLRHAQTTWSLADSAQWQKKQDSVLTALGHLGGYPVSCRTLPAMRQFGDALYWEFGEFYIKVQAGKMPQYEGMDTGLRAPLPWFVSIQGFTQMPYECLNRPI